jgi:hypothetical protein
MFFVVWWCYGQVMTPSSSLSEGAKIIHKKKPVFTAQKKDHTHSAHPSLILTYAIQKNWATKLIADDTQLTEKSWSRDWNSNSKRKDDVTYETTTTSMEPSPSWEPTSLSATQIPSKIRNPAHYCCRLRKSLSLTVSILGQVNVVRAPYPISLIYILILSSQLRLGLCSHFITSGFLPKPVCTLLSCVYIPCLSRHPVLPWQQRWAGLFMGIPIGNSSRWEVKPLWNSHR